MERYYSKCTTPKCGWLYAHEVPLRYMPMAGRMCGQCGEVLVTATEKEWTAEETPQPEETEK
jgi:ssDNA-binding Zn-finger/Zn-ribbon topoisomerase 1